MHNKKGQQVIMGIMVLVMVVIIFFATLPAISSVRDISKGCSYLNCAGFVDIDSTGSATCTGTNQNYSAVLDSDELSCTILNIANPYLILGVLVAVIGLFMRNKLTEESQPQYGYATGGY